MASAPILPPQLRRQSAAISSNSTTYMTAEEFIGYFRRSKSLSEAVKRITRYYPSYREVSIYARARRLECRFDERGRFYQQRKKADSAVRANGGHSSDSDGAADGGESEEQDDDSDEEWQKQQEEEAARKATRRKRDTRQRRYKKVRRVERDQADEDKSVHKAERNGAQEGGSSGDEGMQSDSSYASTSSGSSSGSSSSSVSAMELGESSTSPTAHNVVQSAPPADPLDALQLLAASADSSLLHSSSFAAKSNGDNRASSICTNSLTSQAVSTVWMPSAAAVNTNGTPSALARSAGPASAPSLSLLPSAGPLTRHPLYPSLSAGGLTSSLPVSFQSPAPLPKRSAAYGHLPVSSALPTSGWQHTFAPSCSFPTRFPQSPYVPSPYLASQWPTLSSVPALPAASALSYASGHSHPIGHSQPRAQLALHSPGQQSTSSLAIAAEERR